MLRVDKVYIKKCISIKIINIFTIFFFTVNISQIFGSKSDFVDEAQVFIKHALVGRALIAIPIIIPQKEGCVT